jgi:hypothetical protein
MATRTRPTLAVRPYATTLFFSCGGNANDLIIETTRMEQSSNCNSIHMLNETTTFQNQAIDLDDFVNAFLTLQHHEHFLYVLSDYRCDLLSIATGIGGGPNNPSHTNGR